MTLGVAWARKTSKPPSTVTHFRQPLSFPALFHKWPPCLMSSKTFLVDPLANCGWFHEHKSWVIYWNVDNLSVATQWKIVTSYSVPMNCPYSLREEPQGLFMLKWIQWCAGLVQAAILSEVISWVWWPCHVQRTLFSIILPSLWSWDFYPLFC